jgi:DNA-binding NarL/FixJ family response regulator
LVVEGWTNEEIGVQVHLSASTIKSHVRRILDKSGAANRTDLARRATREGWV